MPQLTKVSEPLRKLTEKNVMFTWDRSQEEAFQAIKSMISFAPLFKYYDVASETTIQCDASESGLGATLLQEGQPVPFASRSLSTVERQYAQIEKECLAIVLLAVVLISTYTEENLQLWKQTTSHWCPFSRSLFIQRLKGYRECSCVCKGTI